MGWTVARVSKCLFRSTRRGYSRVDILSEAVSRISDSEQVPALEMSGRAWGTHQYSGVCLVMHSALFQFLRLPRRVLLRADGEQYQHKHVAATAYHIHQSIEPSSKMSSTMEI